jgi:transcriptional regulator with XRE-family HTH domain
MEWAPAIRRWRAEQGLSLQAAGDRLGVAHTTVRDWERGRQPRDLHQMALCRALGLSSHLDAATPLRARRHARGLSMKQLAKSVHVSTATVSLWERGRRRPSSMHLCHLATALQLDTQQVAQLFKHYPPARGTDRVALPALRQARSASALTQRELARRIGISVATLYQWEGGGPIVPANRVAVVADLLGITPTALTSGMPPFSRATANSSELARLRRRAGLTQRRAAQELGLAIRALAALELNRRPLTVSLCSQLAALYRSSFRDVARAGCLPVDPIMNRARWTPGTLPDVLRFLRTHRGAPATRVAAYAGTRAPTLRRWERGTGRPHSRHLMRLEIYYGLSSGELTNLLPTRGATRV